MIRAEFASFDWHNMTDIETIGSWPLTVRVAALLLMFLLCSALGYQFVIGGLFSELESLMDEGATLHQELEQKLALAAELSAQRTSTQ